MMDHTVRVVFSRSFIPSNSSVGKPSTNGRGLGGLEHERDATAVGAHSDGTCEHITGRRKEATVYQEPTKWKQPSNKIRPVKLSRWGGSQIARGHARVAPRIREWGNLPLAVCFARHP